MKLATALAAGALLMSFALSAQESGTKDVLSAIRDRTSVRAYQDKPVPKEMLETLVRAGMAAPTAVDRRPWAFVVVTDRKTLDAMGDAFENGRMLKRAGAAIVVFGVKDRFLKGEASEMWTQDCSAATENILLAAVGLKLGAVWLGIYPVKERMDTLAKMLSAPDSEVIPFCIISIGWPVAPKAPKDKYDASRIHWEKW